MSSPTNYQEMFYNHLLNVASSAQVLEALKMRERDLYLLQMEKDLEFYMNANELESLNKGIETYKRDIELIKTVMSKRGLSKD